MILSHRHTVRLVGSRTEGAIFSSYGVRFRTFDGVVYGIRHEAVE